ncbi:MAG: nucleotidyltransferase domain-containing protein, partial [Actinobacteria bacterium]|nr:nucleotidyltransferase domain-containing protein [Actinomycetota bacterium]
GDEHNDSDIDLVVVFPEVRDKHAAAVAVRRATSSLPVPLDVIAVDPEELRRRGNEIGSVLRPALREGQVVHDRAA